MIPADKQIRQRHLAEVIRYYLDTGMDYGEWSREYNMHFGYFKWGHNPFRRERMLDEMNQQVFQALQLKDSDNIVFDLGCGLGAPCRSFAKRFPGKRIVGVTIVPWQVEKAGELNILADVDEHIDMVQADYTQLPFASNVADGVFALESCCHSEEFDKAAFIREMMRILKPGQRFVIVDGFLWRDPSTFSSLLGYCYREIIKGWALPSFPLLPAFRERLIKEGAIDVEVRDLSFHVAPSVMHSPFTVVFFLLKKVLKGEKLNAVRIGHLKACFLGLVLGIHRGSFMYGMVTGRKKM
jgi:ubiquinone/menaquinone biosynthesis C-methylase UbiE